MAHFGRKGRLLAQETGPVEGKMRPSNVFAARLKEVRTGKGWTQQQLADQLGELGRTLDRAAIARIEAGDRQVSIDELIEISAALGTTPVHMIVPISGDQPLHVAPRLSVSPREARQWIRGQGPLREEDVRTYYTEVSLDELQDRARRERSLFMSLAQSVVDAVAGSVDDLDSAARDAIADRIDLLNRKLDTAAREEP